MSDAPLKFDGKSIYWLDPTEPWLRVGEQLLSDFPLMTVGVPASPVKFPGKSIEWSVLTETWLRPGEKLLSDVSLIGVNIISLQLWP